MTEDNKLLSTTEAARLLGVSKRRVIALINAPNPERRLPAQMVGSQSAAVTFCCEGRGQECSTLAVREDIREGEPINYPKPRRTRRSYG